MVPSRSGGSRKSPKHPFTKDANAIEVGRRPAHNLQSEIADGVLAQLLGEDYVLDTLPGLEKPTVFDLAVELTDRLVRSVRLLAPLAADRACSPSTSSSLRDEKRVPSLLLSTAERDPVRITSWHSPASSAKFGQGRVRSA